MSDFTKQAAFLNSQTACAMIEAMGMQALNKQREAQGLSMAYDDEAFFALIDKYGIGHNTALTTLEPQ